MNKKTITWGVIILVIIIIIWQWKNIMAMFNGTTTNGSTERATNPCQKGKLYNIGGNNYECCGQDSMGNNIYYPVSTGGCSGPAVGVIKNKVAY